MTPLTLSAQRTMLWLAAPERKDGEQPPRSILAQLERAAVHDELVDAGLIRDAMRGGMRTFFLSDRGRARATRLARTYRRKALEFCLLDAIQAGEITRSTDLRIDDGADPAYCDAELLAAAHRLREMRCIHGGGTAQSDLLRSQVTPLGEAVLESGYAPDDYLTLTEGKSVTEYDQSVHITNSPAAAAATGSSNATSSNNTIVASPVEEFDALMDQIRNQPVTDERAASVVEQQADEIRTELVRGGGRIAEATITQFFTNLMTAYGSQIVLLAERLPTILS